MIDYGIVKSAQVPEALEIDDLSVWVNTDITPVQEETGDGIFNGFVYHQVRFSKDEYFQMIGDKNSSLESQVTNMQLALCDIYEGKV